MHPDSDYPYNYRFSWITGEDMRIIRCSLTIQLYKEAMKDFRKHLASRSYLYGVIEAHLETYSYQDRNKLLTDSLSKKA